MTKEQVYTFKGEFSIAVNGNGLGQHTKLESLLDSLRHSKKEIRIASSGQLYQKQQKRQPKKRWNIRFFNRLEKAVNNTSEKIKFCYHVSASNKTSVHLAYGSKTAYCCKKYAENLTKIYIDDTGNVYVDATEMGNRILERNNLLAIKHPYFIGHLDNDDIIDKMSQAIDDIVYTFEGLT